MGSTRKQKKEDAAVYRQWTPEQKFAIIKEAKESSSVAVVCRKHSIDPSMLTRWRESYETFGLEGLRTHSTAIDHGLRKLKRRTRKVGVFPGEQSLLRLTVSILMDISEEWVTGRKYLSLEDS